MTHCGATKTRLVHEQAISIHEHLYPFTVAIFDQEQGEWGSGTLIQIGQQVFIATAGHVTCEYPNGRLQIIPETPKPAQSGLLAVKRSIRVRSDLIDVGALELPAIALEYLGKKAIEIDRLKDASSGDSDFALVVGYPGKLACKSPLIVRCAASMCRCIPAGEWEALMPLAEDTAAANKEVDVFLGYDDENVGSIRTHEPTGFPPADGFSGGGVWAFGDVPGLWSPQRSKLFGIQTRWDGIRKARRYLRATQIIYWLALVAEHYPKLRRELVARFPRLNAVRKDIV